MKSVGSVQDDGREEFVEEENWSELREYFTAQVLIIRGWIEDRDDKEYMTLGVKGAVISEVEETSKEKSENDEKTGLGDSLREKFHPVEQKSGDEGRL